MAAVLRHRNMDTGLGKIMKGMENMEELSDYQEAQKWLKGVNWDNYPAADDNLATICYALQETERYKDLEKQGKLLELPCAVGNTVYTLNTLQNGKTVIGETTADAFMCALCTMEGRFGKTVFLTAGEAEAALEKILK